MADKNNLVPMNPNEVVVPIGKANLITTQEEVDKALEIASHIFREQNEEQPMENSNLNQELETSLEVTSEPITSEQELVELSSEELAVLPTAKFGRDNFGRALNKNGTIRKARNDKGVIRGAYGPRTPKDDSVNAPQPTPAPIALAAENVESNDDNVF